MRIFLKDENITPSAILLVDESGLKPVSEIMKIFIFFVLIIIV